MMNGYPPGPSANGASRGANGASRGANGASRGYGPGVAAHVPKPSSGKHIQWS